ncbi:hypothetical protein L596_029328 [Steinernema carpocapsae]|uniref:ShKT domain-containing protein n=1 Tax=Steinernema carpocapsae TaxID=34508 RepID=A0A4U5LUB6_STECR|nr:hypothetical protein L596_029328 [Steinernema carpocapsae]
MCKDATQGVQVRQQCPKTCNACDEIFTTTTASSTVAATTPPSCKDTDPKSCLQNARFCYGSPNFSVWMRNKCPKTCGLC